VPSELGEWLEEEVGTRDERLVTDPDLAAPLVAAREEVLDQLIGTIAEIKDLRETYRESLQETDRLDRDDPQFEELLQEAKLAKRRFNIFEVESPSSRSD
jgi:vacuolar-type H+-ATPase subunit D/Vma8